MMNHAKCDAERAKKKYLNGHFVARAVNDEMVTKKNVNHLAVGSVL